MRGGALSRIRISPPNRTACATWSNTAGRTGPFQVDVELRYQPIAYRWAQNLRAYDATETRRFVNWYDEMASGSSQVLASAMASMR